jgi:Mn2+/Fe2+ NRAMP family transporter
LVRSYHLLKHSHLSNSSRIIVITLVFIILVILVLSVIVESGGDVLKFAGDAMIVLYPPKALMCSLDSRKKDATVNEVRVDNICI